MNNNLNFIFVVVVVSHLAAAAKVPFPSASPSGAVQEVSCDCRCQNHVVVEDGGKTFGNCHSVDESGKHFCYVSLRSAKACGDARPADQSAVGHHAKRKYVSYKACSTQRSLCDRDVSNPKVGLARIASEIEQTAVDHHPVEVQHDKVGAGAVVADIIKESAARRPPTAVDLLKSIAIANDGKAASDNIEINHKRSGAVQLIKAIALANEKVANSAEANQPAANPSKVGVAAIAEDIAEKADPYKPTGAIEVLKAIAITDESSNVSSQLTSDPTKVGVGAITEDLIKTSSTIQPSGAAEVIKAIALANDRLTDSSDVAVKSSNPSIGSTPSVGAASIVDDIIVKSVDVLNHRPSGTTSGAGSISDDLVSEAVHLAVKVSQPSTTTTKSDTMELTGIFEAIEKQQQHQQQQQSKAETKETEVETSDEQSTTLPLEVGVSRIEPEVEAHSIVDGTSHIQEVGVSGVVAAIQHEQSEESAAHETSGRVSGNEATSSAGVEKVAEDIVAHITDKLGVQDFEPVDLFGDRLRVGIHRIKDDIVYRL